MPKFKDIVVILLVDICKEGSTLFFSYKNMLSRSEPREEIEIATNKITTMFLYFSKSEPQRSYKHGSYKKKRVYSDNFFLCGCGH